MTERIVPNPNHPAKYSEPIFALVVRLVADETKRAGRRLRVIDPMGGVGRTHDLAADTVTGELELGWAACRRPSVLADAARPPFRPRCFDVYVTSCVYGNRLSDHHEPKDTHKACEGRGCRGCSMTGISPRKTYRVSNGGPLHERNAGRLQWGIAYRELHVEIWAAIPELVAPGGLVIVNVSDHERDHEVQDVVDWHRRQLRASGVVLCEEYAVPTKRLRRGANYAARVPVEHVIVGRVA